MYHVLYTMHDVLFTLCICTYVILYTLLYSTLLYSTLLYSTLLYSTLLYSTLLYSTLLYSTLLYYTILYYTILYYTIDYIPPAQFKSLGDGVDTLPASSYGARLRQPTSKVTGHNTDPQTVGLLL